MFKCEDDIFKETRKLLNVKSDNNELNTIDLAKYFKKNKILTGGKSGSSVYLISPKDNLKVKYILKVTPLQDYLVKKSELSKSFIKYYQDYREILILCQLNQLKSKCFPKLLNWGFTNSINPWNKNDNLKQKCLYIVETYGGTINLKTLLNRKKPSISLKKYKQIFMNILNCYIKANKKYGFIHDDLKNDNIMIDKNNPVIIDFGWSSSKKYPPNYNLRYLGDKGLFSLIPGFKKSALIYNKTLLDKELYVGFGINYKYADINKLILMYNYAQRQLKGEELVLTEKDIKYFNSNRAFYNKLEYLKKMI